MNTNRFWTYGLVASLLFALLLGIPQIAAADQNDPPTRAGRISYLKGSVSFEPAGTTEWGNAALNRPMTIGDRIWTDTDARAEIHAGAASLHLDQRTGVSFLNLDDKTIQVRLSEGALDMRVREINEGEIYEVDTPNLAFTVTRAGSYRFDVNENGDYTGVTVFRGEGEVTAGGKTYQVRAGERADFNGTEELQYNTSRAPEPDAFDRWAMERDTRGDRSTSARYVSRDVTGYEDLDDYGTWRTEPDYGPVWYPSVYPGWVPYRYGSWAWIDPWGWTWVDDEPWGFAPFHYGRWAFIGGAWGWCPGPLFVRPVFAPAFVSFFAFGHSSFFGFGFGGPVGWFPLGFGDPFFPWFPCSRVFITNINITNTRIRNINILNTNIRNVNFVNAHVAGAVTAVPRNVFAGGQPVGRAAMRVSANELASARVANRLDVSPTWKSRLGAVGSGRVPPAAVRERAVVSRATPAPNAGFRTRPATGRGTLAARNAGVAPGSAPLSRGGERARMADRPNGRFGAADAARGPRGAESPRMQPNERLRNDRPPSASRGVNERMSRPAERAPVVRGGEQARPMNAPADRGARVNRADRPPWASRGEAPQTMREMGRSPRTAPESRGMSPRSMDRTPAGASRSIERQGSPRSMDRPPASAPRSFSRERAPMSSPQAGRFADRPPAARFEGRSTEAPRTAPRDGSPGRSFEGRGYQAPSRNYGDSSPRSYSEPRSYSSAPRSYSAPSRSYGYSAPRSYSAPSRSYGYSAPRSYSSSGGGRGSSGSARGGGSSGRSSHGR